MSELREIGAGSTALAVPALLALRPVFAHEDLVDTIDQLLAWLLAEWLKAEGVRTGCAELHLDPAVGPERAPTHRLYLHHHLQISADHFHGRL